MLSTFLLQTILAGDKRLSPLSIVLESLGMSAFFFGGFSVILAIGMLLGLSLFLMAYYAGASEIKNDLEIHFSKISRAVMRLATMGVALFASFAYVGSFNLKSPVDAKQKLEVLVKPVEPIVARYVPNFSSKSNLKEIAAQILPADLKLASETQKNEAIAQISSRLADTLTNSVGVRVAPMDRVIDILYKASIGRMLTLTPLLQNLILIVLGLIFFLFIKFLLLFVDWGATLLGYGFYALLKTFGFFKIELQNVPKRVIILE